jgi:hypothetical protein
MTAKEPKRPRPKLPPVSEEMKQWSAMLGQELQQWPRVTSRPMFGFQCFYRGKNIFAALPATRGINTPNSLMFRIKPMPPDLEERAKKERRIETENKTPGAKWFLFELSSADDLRDALWWLNEAYERAK